MTAHAVLGLVDAIVVRLADPDTVSFGSRTLSSDRQQLLRTVLPESRSCTSSWPRAASLRGTVPTTGSSPPRGSRSPAARTATRSTECPPSPTP